MSSYKKKATKNIIVSISFKMILLIIGLFLRRYLVNYLGNEVTGLFSLYTSILGFLAVAELGIGSAIVFSMYKPIVEDDKDRISALYFLYKKIYFVIFVVIMIVGLIITPFLPILAKESTSEINLYYTYVIFLIATSVTYLYAYKTSFINAHMDNYITDLIRSVFQVLEYVFQIIVIIIFKSFILFLLIILLSNIFQWITTNFIFNKNYKVKINNNKELDDNLKQEVKEKTKALFYHKIGALFMNTTDNILISSFLSVTLLGMYSNYVLIITNMSGILSLTFTSIITVIGHAFAKMSKETLNNEYKKLYTLNYILSLIFFLGFYSISEELIVILFNDSVVLHKNIVIILTINFYLQFARSATLSFRDASGVFYYDRFRPLITGLTNIILSLIFIQFWGLSGVLVVTIFTNGLITHIVEPYVLYKYGFEMNPKKYYFYHYMGIVLFLILIIGFSYIPFPNIGNIYLMILVKGFSSVLISFIALLLLLLISKTFRNSLKSLFKDISKFITRRNNE